MSAPAGMSRSSCVRREHGVDHVLRHVALRIEDEADLRAIRNRLADRVVVHVEADLRARLHQLAGAVREDVAVLADGVLDERAAGHRLIVGSDEARDLVVHDARRGARTRLRFDRLDVAILGETRIRQIVRPPIGTRRRDRDVRRHRDDEIRLADVPAVRIVEHLRRGHVGRVAARRAAVHPRRDRRDLVVGQRRIVLELVDACRRCGRRATAASGARDDALLIERAHGRASS